MKYYYYTFELKIKDDKVQLGWRVCVGHPLMRSMEVLLNGLITFFSEISKDEYEHLVDGFPMKPPQKK